MGIHIKAQSKQTKQKKLNEICFINSECQAVRDTIM